MRTSLEIVPRSVGELDAAVALIAARYPGIDTVNLPDRPNCVLGSVAAAHCIRGRIAHRIPHLRSHDFDKASAASLVARLNEYAIDEVIVVAGDRRGEGGFEPVQLIAFLRAHASAITVYAALDPYRYRDADALARNVNDKLRAGASGFFTQPLFDLGELDRCAPHLRGTTTFWGLSPVVSPKSQRYWEEVNGVWFPSGFSPTLKWNHAFALRFLSEVADRGDNAYLMPIKVDIESYLTPLESKFAIR